MESKSMHPQLWMIILGFLIFLPGSKFANIPSTVTTASSTTSTAVVAVNDTPTVAGHTGAAAATASVSSLVKATKSSTLKNNTINDKTFLRTQSKRESPTIKIAAAAITGHDEAAPPKTAEALNGAEVAVAVSGVGAGGEISEAKIDTAAILSAKTQLTAEVKSPTSISATTEITKAQNTNRYNNNSNNNNDYNGNDNINNNIKQKIATNTSLSIATNGSASNKSANRTENTTTTGAPAAGSATPAEKASPTPIPTTTPTAATSVLTKEAKLVATLASIESSTSSSSAAITAPPFVASIKSDAVEHNRRVANDKSYKSLINNISSSNNSSSSTDRKPTEIEIELPPALGSGSGLAPPPARAEKLQSLKPYNDDAKQKTQPVKKVFSNLMLATVAIAADTMQIGSNQISQENEFKALSQNSIPYTIETAAAFDAPFSHGNSVTPTTTTAATAATTTTSATASPTTLRTTRRPLPTTTLKPPPTIDDYQTIISQAGTHAYLPCNVKQLVKKPISWLRVRDGHILTVDQTTFIADQRFQSIYTSNPERWSLQIKYVQLKDEGTYECQVSTEPKASAIVQLRIVEPKTELIGESTRHVKAGSQVKLRCIISQALEPPLFINWFYNQKQIYLHNRRGWRTEIERIDLPTEMPATQSTPSSGERGYVAAATGIDTPIAPPTHSYILDGISVNDNVGVAAPATLSKYKQPTSMSGTATKAKTQTPTTASASVAAAATSSTLLPAYMTVSTMTAAITNSTLTTLAVVDDAMAMAAQITSILPVAAASYKTLLATTTTATRTTTTMLPSSSFIKQITTASLIIPSVAKQDSGNYTCSPSNSAPRTVVLHVLNGEYSASAITSASASWYNVIGSRFRLKYIPFFNLSTILMLTWIMKFVLLKIITNCDMSKNINAKSYTDNFNWKRQWRRHLSVVSQSAAQARGRHNKNNKNNHNNNSILKDDDGAVTYECMLVCRSNDCSISHSQAELEDKT